MELDPIELKEQAEEAHRSRLNSFVAVTIALLATFMGLCKVKDDNIVQAMQQAQADRVDFWGEYQAKNTQAKLFEIAASQSKVQALGLTGAAKDAALKQSAFYEAEAKREAGKKADSKKDAEKAAKDYDASNYRDDQFDLSDASLAIAVSLLAVTALTQKKWLFWVALVPAAAGVLMGIAAFASLNLHPDFIIKFLN